MDAPKCRLCGVKHYGLCAGVEVDEAVLDSSEPALTSEELALESGAIEESVSKGLGREGCVECGATAATFEDAEKWRKLKARQREYMRRRRLEGEA